MSLRGWEDFWGEQTLDADVVIVGSGPGGAAISRVLAEGGLSVVVLEEGPARSVFRPNMPHTMRYHMQEGGSMIAAGSAAVAVAAGRGVGGGSLINSAICWRTPDYVLEDWQAKLGDDRYDVARMGAVFDELEEILQIVDTPEQIAGENNLLVVRGARALGMKAGLLRRNTPFCVGCGVCNYGCPSGGKASVDRNLIPMARAAGAIVQGDARVDEILVRDGRARGVVAKIRHQDTRQEVGRLTVNADRVIVSAGAVGTPRLLHTAGVAGRMGDRVGRGMHLHPGNGVLGLCDHKVEMWRGATQAAYFEDPELPGVLPHTMSMPPGALMLASGKMGLAGKELMKQAPYITGCLTMISDKGEGSVSVNPDGSARMTYWFTDDDVNLMRRGLRRTCEVLLAGGARRLMVPVHGADWVDDLEAAGKLIDQASIRDWKLLYSAHPMATCRMGSDIETSVIGVGGEAHGLPGLYIADGSIFPTALGVNPQLTIMALATLMGRSILAEA